MEHESLLSCVAGLAACDGKRNEGGADARVVAAAGGRGKSNLRIVTHDRHVRLFQSCGEALSQDEMPAERGKACGVRWNSTVAKLVAKWKQHKGGSGTSLSGARTRVDSPIRRTRRKKFGCTAVKADSGQMREEIFDFYIRV